MDGQVLYELSNIPKRNVDFKPLEDNKNVRWLKLYDNIKNGLKHSPIVCLIGDRGEGKTQLGCSIIGFCCMKLCKSALYTKSFDIFLEIRAGMKGQDGKSEISSIEKFLKPYLLVIDAFEVRGETAFENRTLDHIIDKRYDAEKATIIISNDKKPELEKILGPSIISRMQQIGGIVEMKTEFFRNQEVK